MDKKKVFAIALFLLMGLFMFSYANPLSNNDNNLENGNETTNNDTTNNESNDIKPVAGSTSSIKRSSAYNIVTPSYVETKELVTNNNYNDNSNLPLVKKVINLSLNGESIITMEANTNYTESGATVLIDNNIVITNLKPVEIRLYDNLNNFVVVSKVDTTKVGKYELIYSYSDNDKNKAFDITDATKDYVNRLVNVVDTTSPTIKLNGAEELTIEAGTQYTELNATAIDNVDGTWSIEPDVIHYSNNKQKAVVVDKIDTTIVGKYEIQYSCKDHSGNECKDEQGLNSYVTRIVNVVDTTSPVITLNGEEKIALEVNSEYTELGASASDNAAGNISINIVGDKVNTKKLGTYIVKYTAEDLAGNISTIIRTVNVVDTTAPRISLNGAADITIEGGSKYTELGVNMTDNYDATKNNIYPIAIKYSKTNTNEDEVLVQSVNTLKLGTYKLLYIVKDSSNNQALDANDYTKNYVMRYVHVVDTTSPVITLNGNRIINIEAGSTYTELNATAKDIIDGTWTVKPEFIDYSINGKFQGKVDAIDTTKVGQYKVSYSCKDLSGNVCKDERRLHTSIVRTVNVVDTTAPVITLNGSENITIEVNSEYKDLGVTTKDNDSNIKVNITGDKVDTKKLGTYKVIYTATDSYNNKSSIIRNVKVVDTTSPIMSLNGNSDITIEGGSKYIDQGVKVTDNYDSNIKANVTIKYIKDNQKIVVNSVDTFKLGTYEIMYTAKDSSKNSAKDINNKDFILRYVHVVDTTAPTITLNGSNNIKVELGTKYSEQGATAKDIIDGNTKVSINGKVDSNKVGTYNVIYTSQDNAGNESKIIRTVTVSDTTAPTITLIGNENIKMTRNLRDKDKDKDKYKDKGVKVSDLSNYNLNTVITFTKPYATASKVVDSVDTSVVGTYIYTYTATDIYGNLSSVTRTIINDQILDSKLDMRVYTYINGKSFELDHNYVEVNTAKPTFTANIDDVINGKIFNWTDEDTSKYLTIDDSRVDMNKVGVYKVIFTAKDWAGNIKNVTEYVHVEDTIKPVITLNKNKLVRTYVGDNIYLDLPEATVTDNYDSQVNVSINKYNSYRKYVVCGDKYITGVTYYAKDSNGNETEYFYQLPNKVKVNK